MTSFKRVKTKEKNILKWESADAQVYVIDNPLAGWDFIVQYNGEETIENYPDKKTAIFYAKKWMEDNN